MKSQKSLQKAVAKGAALLDEKVPGWVEMFIAEGKKNGFDLSDPEVCVLGNVFGPAQKKVMAKYDREVNALPEDFVGDYPKYPYEDGFDFGADQLGLKTFNKYTSHGFSASTREEFQMLSEFWQIEILKRTMEKPKFWASIISIFRRDA